MMISNTVNPKGMSPSRMRHVAMLFIFSLKFTHVKMKGTNKSIQPQKSPNGYYLAGTGLGLELMGKQGSAWVSAWVGAWVLSLLLNY